MVLLAGRYELAEPLGAGGMAQVSAAHDRVLDRRVAVKLIHPGQLSDPVSRERFTREAQAAAALHHPNTVAVFDYGEDAGRPFIVMELVDGPSLAGRLRSAGPLSVDEATDIAGAVLDGLAAAHARGMVHRDVKPSNILLPRGGGVKLADFGIATVVDPGTTLTTAGQVIGTPRYLAPECADGDRATPASDVYSLGAVLFECLAGRAPYVAESPIALAVAHRSEPVPSLAAAAPGTPPAVAAAVERSLAKDPAERFPDAAAMRAELTRASAGGPASAAAVPGVATRVLDMEGEQTATVEPGTDGGVGWGWWVAVVAVVAVVTVAALLLALRGDDEPGSGEAGERAGTEETAVGDPDDEPDDEPDDQPDDEGGEPDEPADAAGVADLDSLIAAVAARTDLGEKGDDLLDDLRDLRNGPSAEEAWELIEDIADWMANGELDVDAGTQSVTVLESEFRPNEPDLQPVSELMADVAITMPEWGEKGDDLLDDLTTLLGIGPPGQRMQHATDLVQEIDKWQSNGELDPNRAAEALAVLTPLARPSS